ncbi:MAG: hypothetical protein JSS02_20590 [Planctomycetes bacterium]|nr:hypothetical protein [Planctomycetota bacterium]
MPEILRTVSDDQIALGICFAAVAISGLIMHFSIHVGRLTGRVRLHQTPEQGSVQLPEIQVAPTIRTENTSVRERAA